MNVFRTASFLASCLGTFMCIFAAFICSDMGQRAAALEWLGWGCVWVVAVFIHWTLDRRYGKR